MEKIIETNHIIWWKIWKLESGKIILFHDFKNTHVIAKTTAPIKLKLHLLDLYRIGINPRFNSPFPNKAETPLFFFPYSGFLIIFIVKKEILKHIKIKEPRPTQYLFSTGFHTLRPLLKSILCILVVLISIIFWEIGPWGHCQSKQHSKIQMGWVGKGRELPLAMVGY